MSGQGDDHAAKLPVGPVVGIVIGCLAGVIMIGAAAMWYVRRVCVRRPHDDPLDEPLELEFGSEVSSALPELVFVPPKPPT
jgi:hypothetical protein